MKMNFRFFALFSILLILTTSHSRKDQPVQRLITVDALYGTLKIDPDKVSTINLSTFADSIWMVPLESTPNCIFSLASKILIDDGLMFIADYQDSEALFCFSKQGKFIFKIDRKGRGPGEYISLTDFTLDKTKNRIIIADRESQSLLLFDYEGRYLNTIKCGLYFDYLAHLGGNELLLMTDHSTNLSLPQGKQYQALIYDYRENRVTQGFIEFDAASQRFQNIIGIYNCISESTPNPHFYVTGTRTIWTTRNDSLLKMLDVSFGNKNLPDDFLDKTSYEKQEEYYRAGTYIQGFDNFQVIGNWIICHYVYMRQNRSVFINLNSGQSYQTGRNVINDLGKFPIVALPLFQTDGENLISVIPGEAIATIAQHPIAKEYLTKEFLEFTEDSNPVVQFIRMKK